MEPFRSNLHGAAVKFIFLLPLLLLLAFFFPLPAMSIAAARSNFTDLDSLLAFKSLVVDQHGILAANWTGTSASFCSWLGVSCSRRHRQRVVSIDLTGFSLQGTISRHLANLSFLSYLDLSNNSLTGSIPQGIGRLPRLANLYLNNNSLSGQIPFSIFNMTSLTELNLKYNELEGPLPSKDDQFNLPTLQFISLAKNKLSGPIPTGFTRCSNLQVLKLSYNEFTGTIPVQLGNITTLTNLVLGSNQLTGTIPTSLGNLTRLNELSMSINTNLEGAIPEELGNLPDLQILNLGGNSLTGSIPMALLNASKLFLLQLTSNNLTGSVPSTIGYSYPLLSWLGLAANQLTGGLDFITSLSNCRRLKILDLAINEIGGFLPDSVGNLSSRLETFNAGGIVVRGKIPSGFGNLSSLLGLDLEDNELTGPLPSTITRMKNLQSLDLSGNRISGSIPSEIGLMTSLNTLNLDNNALSGPIPRSLANISTLQHLSLSRNGFFSEVPSSLWSVSVLVELSLSHNLLNGSLPLEILGLKSLDKLDISNNQLSGNISNALGNLQMLTVLDISSNSFHGQIPQSFSSLIEIKYLNLSHNFLSGAIPKSLTSLTQLVSLDLSFNTLEGQIPEGRVFSNISIPILNGNSALCGAPRLGFPPCPASTSKKSMNLLKYVLPPVVLFIILLSCLYLILHMARRKNKPNPIATDTSLNDHRLISYHELVRATDNFSKTNLLGMGSVSSVFRACLDDGLLVAVKVLNLEVQGCLRNFDTECNALSMVRHRNLVKVISTCSNMDFKALVLQYMPNGSLERWLHSHNDHHLNLHQRLDIMEDVSVAIRYLHHHHPHVVVHCDIKPGNVLLDENMVGHVGDFGIAKLFLDESTSIMSTSAPGTIGYMAPEYGFAGKVSRKGDVYSYGILLLETFTSRRPCDSMFGEDLSLRQWVSNAYPSAVLEIVDCTLLRDNYILESAVHRCLSSIIELGLLCSSDLPKDRVPMTEVVPAIQKIKKCLSNPAA